MNEYIVESNESTLSMKNYIEESKESTVSPLEHVFNQILHPHSVNLSGSDPAQVGPLSA